LKLTGLDKKYLSLRQVAFNTEKNINSFLTPSGLAITLKGTLLYCDIFAEDGYFDLTDDMKLANDPNSPNTIKVSHDVLYGFILDTHVYLAKFSSLGFEGYFSDDKEINSYYFDKETFNETAVVVNLLDNNEKRTNRVTCTKYFIENKTAFDYRAQGQIISDNLFRHFTTDCSMPEIPNPYNLVIPVFKAIQFHATEDQKVWGLSLNSRIATPIAGTSSSFSIAYDQFKNFAFITSTGSFAYLFSGLFSINENIFWNGNFSYSSMASVSISEDVYLDLDGEGYKDVTQIRGPSTSAELSISYGGISYIQGSDGLFKGFSISVGVGAGFDFSSMTTTSMVFAFTITDLEKMNEVIVNINKDIADNAIKKTYLPIFIKGDVRYSNGSFHLILLVNGYNKESKKIEEIKSYDFIDLKLKDNCIFTNNVIEFESINKK